MRPGLAQFLPKSRPIVAVVVLTFLSALEATGCKETASPAATKIPGCADAPGVRVGCPCPAPLEPFAGGCAARAVLAEGCGPRPDPTDLNCAAVICGRGEAFDPLRGTCLPSKELAELPEVAWLGLHEGEKLVCAEGSLELAQGRVGCRPATLCRSRTVWDGKACTKPASCPVGAYRDGAVCKPFVTNGAVDLPTWAKRVLEPSICPLLPVTTSAESFRIAIDAPGNALAHLSLSVESTATDLPLVRHAAEAHLEALRSLQGDATTTKADLTVTCPGRPFPSPKVDVSQDAGP